MNKQKVMNKRKVKIFRGECPACGKIIQIEEDVREFEYVDCPSCYEFLAIVSLNPVNFQIAYLGYEDS